MVKLAGLLREHRIRAELTQQQLAQVSSVSVRTIRSIEAGQARSIRRTTAKLLADALLLNDEDRAVFEVASCSNTPMDVLRPVLAPERTPAQHVVDPLIGRETEVDELIGRLESQMSRLVVVNGLEGTGKSRLALEVIQRVRDKRGAASLWVPVAEGDVSSPPNSKAADWLAAQIRELLSDSSPTDAFVLSGLTDLLSSMDVIVVLDGVNNAPPQQDLIPQLLAACPQLRILATSRSPVALQTDFPFTLGPLPVPGCAEASAPGFGVEECPSVVLFRRYLRQAVPELGQHASSTGHIASICCQLDGIPAALKLAAQWASVHSLASLDWLTCNDPFILRPPTTAGSGFGLYEAVAEGINGATPAEQRILSARALDGRWWTVEEAATVTGTDLNAATHSVYLLLARGLLKRSIKNGQVHLRALNLARAAMRAIVKSCGRAGSPNRLRVE